MKRTVFYELQGGEPPLEGKEEMFNFPQTYLVVRFARHVHPEALAWFLRKVQAARKDGGAGLLVARHPTSSSKTKGISIHISASTDRILEAAEEMEMCKKDSSGLIREFIFMQVSDFLLDEMLPDDLFTLAERQTIAFHELQGLRTRHGEGHLPGYKHIKLYPDQSIFQIFKQKGFIEIYYPLHDNEALKKLSKRWYKSFWSSQPYEDIREYFGESVALYFIFLGFYTTALIPPTILGLLAMLIPQTTTVFFCFFNVLWVTLFLEMWKRKSSEYAFLWGTIGMTSLDEPRCEHRGVIGLDEATGRHQPQYPRWKTNLKMYCASLPLVFLCVVIAFIIMLFSFWAENWAIENRRDAGDESIFATIFVCIPSIIYSGLVFVMNLYYRRLATNLTEWENHRTQSQFERHRVTKLVIFEFINNFMSLFYIAFIIQDMEMLRWQLTTMLIILQALNNVQETLLPLFIRDYGKQVSNWLKGKKKSDKLMKDEFAEQIEEFLGDVRKLPEDEPRVEQAIKEARMDPYEYYGGTYDDYLEMFIQFGYVFLFSSVYPIAAFWAVANNVLEIRTDAFKLCRVCQRPMPRRVKDIGAWQKAFEAIGALSIMTNCGLLALSPELRNLAPDTPLAEWVLLFLGIEHVLLALRYLINIAIPERPQWVRVQLAKVYHQSKMALKNERRNKRFLHLGQPAH